MTPERRTVAEAYLRKYPMPPLTAKQARAIASLLEIARQHNAPARNRGVATSSDSTDAACTDNGGRHGR